MKEFAAPLSRLSLSGVRARRRSASVRAAQLDGAPRDPLSARQDSFDSQRTARARPGSAATCTPASPPASDVLFDVCVAAYDYLHATDRQGHEEIHRAFAQKDVFARLPVNSGIRRLTLFFLPIALEPLHADESEALKRARACLNLAYLLLPPGDPRAQPYSSATAAKLRARDDALDTLCRKLHHARQLMRMRRCNDSQEALQQAIEEAATLHREGGSVRARAAKWPFSDTYKILFEAEWLGLCALANEVLRQDGWPDNHPSYSALWNLTQLAHDYRLSSSPTHSVVIPARKPLKRSMTASSSASRQLAAIPEEYSAFSDDASSDEDDNSSDWGHDPFGFDHLDEGLWATPPPSTTVTEATSWRSLYDPLAHPAGVAATEGGQRPHQEPSMRFSDLVHPGRLWNPKNDSAGRDASSRHTHPKAQQEKVAMNQRTRITQPSESVQPRLTLRPADTDAHRRNASEYYRGVNGELYESDGHGSGRLVPAAAARHAGPTASGFVDAALPDNASPTVSQPPVPARHRSMQPKRATDDANNAIRLNHAADVAQKSVSQWGQGAVHDNLETDEETEVASSDGSEGPLDQALRELGLTKPPGGPAAPRAAFESGAPFDNAAVRPLNPGHMNAPGNNEQMAASKAAAKGATGGYGVGAMFDNAKNAASPSTSAAASNSASPFGQGAPFDNARSASTKPADKANASQTTAQFGQGAPFDNARSAPANEAAPPSHPAGSFGEGAMFDNLRSAPLPPTPIAQPSHTAASFGEGAMFDNLRSAPLPPTTTAQASHTAGAFGEGPMFDNLRSAPLPPTKTAQPGNRAAQFGQGEPFDNASAAPSVKFAPHTTRSDGRPGRSIGYAKLDRGAIDDGQAPTEWTTSQDTAPGGVDAAAAHAAEAAPVGSVRMRGTVATAPDSRRTSLFSAGLLRPLSTLVTSAPPAATHPVRAAQAPRSQASRRAMPTTWRSEFDAATNAAIERCGADAPLDALVKAFASADYAAALLASKQAFARVSATYWGRTVMRHMYTDFFVGALPDGLSCRLQQDWSARRLEDLAEEVAFLQHMGTFFTSASHLARSSELLPAFASWTPDWPTLEAYNALLVAIDSGLPNGARGPTQAQLAIRTQLQLRGPVERFEIQAGNQTVVEKDPAALDSEASSMWAAIDRAMWRLEETSGPQPVVVVLHRQRVVQLRCSSREALETYYNDMEAFLETMVRKFARTRTIDANDTALLSKVEQARSVELACDALKARFAPARERA